MPFAEIIAGGVQDGRTDVLKERHAEGHSVTVLCSLGFVASSKGQPKVRSTDDSTDSPTQSSSQHTLNIEQPHVRNTARTLAYILQRLVSGQKQMVHSTGRNFSGLQTSTISIIENVNVYEVDITQR